MGNQSCGEFCGNPAIDKQEIVQIDITPRYDAIEWVKEQPMPGSTPRISKLEKQMVEHFNIEEKVANQKPPIQLIMWEDDITSQVEEISDIPPVETKVEQNHTIVPTFVVQQRVPNELKLMINKQFSRSPLENDCKWYLLPSGNYFNGMLNDNMPSGIGTYLLPNKLFYGEVQGSKPSGKGVVLGTDLVFQGQFKQGRATGQATLNYDSSNVQGLFQNGRIENGKITNSQYEYEGGFLDGELSGKGTYQSFASNTSYTGQFWKGKFHGVGTFACPLYVYKGEFLNGMKHGNGSIEYSQEQSKNKKGVWDSDYFMKET